MQISVITSLCCEGCSNGTSVKTWLEWIALMINTQTQTLQRIVVERMHSKLLSGKLHKIFWESLILYWSTNIRNNSFYAVYFNHAFILHTGFGPAQQWNKSSTIRYWKYDLFTGIERAFHIFCLPEPKAKVKYCPFISLLGIYIIDLFWPTESISSQLDYP